MKLTLVQNIKLLVLGHVTVHVVPGAYLDFYMVHADCTNDLLTLRHDGELTVCKPCWLLILRKRWYQKILAHVRVGHPTKVPIYTRRGMGDVGASASIRRKLRAVITPELAGLPALVYQDEVLLESYRGNWLVDRGVYTRLLDIPYYAIKKQNNETTRS